MYQCMVNTSSTTAVNVISTGKFNCLQLELFLVKTQCACMGCWSGVGLSVCLSQPAGLE